MTGVVGFISSPVALALISGPLAVWGLQHVLTIRKRRADATRETEDRENDERDREHEERVREREERDREREREERHLSWRDKVAEAQATEQHTALASADERYRMLHDDYLESRTSVVGLREAVWSLIDLVDKLLLARLHAAADSTCYTVTLELDEVGEARRVMNEARHRLR